MKRETGHVHAGSRRRVRADDARRSTRRAFLLAAAAWPLIAIVETVRAQLVGCNSREAYCTEQVRDDELNSLVGYGVAPNPPYKSSKVIE